MHLFADDVGRRSLLQYKATGAAERAVWRQCSDSTEDYSQPCLADTSKTTALRRTVLHHTRQHRTLVIIAVTVKLEFPLVQFSFVQQIQNKPKVYSKSTTSCGICSQKNRKPFMSRRCAACCTTCCPTLSTARHSNGVWVGSKNDRISIDWLINLNWFCYGFCQWHSQKCELGPRFDPFSSLSFPSPLFFFAFFLLFRFSFYFPSFLFSFLSLSSP